MGKVIVSLFLIGITTMFTSCLNGVSNADTDTSASSSTLSNETVTIEMEIVLTALPIPADEIEVSITSTNVPSNPDIEFFTIPSRSDDTYISEFSIPYNEEVTITYTIFNESKVVARNIEVIKSTTDSSFTTYPDNAPQNFSIGENATIYIGEKFIAHPTCEDNSDRLIYLFDLNNNGTFGSSTKRYFSEEGDFLVIGSAFDGLSTVYDTITVTVLTYSEDKNLSSESDDLSTNTSSYSKESSNKEILSSENESSNVVYSRADETSSVEDNLSSESPEPKIFTITYIQTTGGTVAGTESIAQESSIPMTQKSNPGYSFEKFTITQGNGEINNKTLQFVTSDITISGTFSPITWDIEIETTGSCGTVQNEDSYTYIFDGSNTTIKTNLDTYCNAIFTSEHLSLTQNTITGVTAEALELSSPLKVSISFTEETIPSSDITVDCYLDNVLQESCNGEYGSVTPNNFTLYEHSNSKNLTTKFNSGFTLDELIDDSNVLLTQKSVSYIKADIPGKVKANFTRKRYSITLSSSGNGSANASTTLSGPHNVEQKTSIAVSPYQGYSFSHWSGTGCILKASHINNPSEIIYTCTQDGIITAHFKKIAVTGIDFDIESMDLSVDGPTKKITPIVKPSHAFDKSITWSTSWSSIATVSNGLVSGKKLGTVTISATTNDGNFKKSLVVNVNSFKDSRDGTEYKTTLIGDQRWFAENLRYDTTSSMCYNQETCDKYGRYYNVESEASKLEFCPVGWHTSTISDWSKLRSIIDDGDDLKAETLWANSGHGNDKFSFNALPGGSISAGKAVNYNGEFLSGLWLTTSNNSAGDRYYLQLSHDSNLLSTNVHEAVWFGTTMMSIRCVMD
ncbi:MAG: Ig-like domain-containing protein [Fibrobacterales bacterium]